MSFKRLFIYGSVAVIWLVIIFVMTCLSIGSSVKEACQLAQDKYEGNCVDSLIVFLDDEENSFKDRNTAIWALGQLGDVKALETLNNYYTGNIPDREPLEEGISQYELKKAIKLCEGGVNISALFWRKSVL